MSDNEGESVHSASDSEVETEAADFSAALKRLKSKDPDFYEFLQENDKELLNFRDDEDEEPSEEEEDDEESVGDKPFSATKLEYIKQEIKSKPTVKICKELVSAFKRAVKQADGQSTKSDMANCDLFNDIIKLCFIELVPALKRILKVGEESGKKFDPSKSKNWKKMQKIIKSYLIELLKLLSAMKETSVLVLMLKHIIHLIPYFLKFIKLSKLMLKKIISLWSSEEETIRVLSIIIIVRTTKSMPSEYLDPILKKMYFAYVQNTKFTSPTSWPMINFMKRSMTEVYSLNPEIAYQHAFTYTRQMAIHLRNANTTKKKESFQVVYNWQFVHCLLFWSHLVCRLISYKPIEKLLFPVVQTICATITLLPTAKYVPLRFHLVKSLINISRETDVFIPVLPFILDVLTLVDFNKKSNFSIRPVNFDCALKVTKSQLQEAGFKEKCIEEVCNAVIDYLKVYACCIGFPELTFVSMVRLKDFTKQCKVPKYNQQVKAVLSKIKENADFISSRREGTSFDITDGDSVKRWEDNMREIKVPLLLKDEIKTENVALNKKRKVK